MLGVKYSDILISVDNLISILRSQGKYEAIEKMNRRALKEREKVLEVKYPNILTSIYNLVYLFHDQQRYNDASILFFEASAGLSKTLGPDYPTTQNCSYHYSSMICKMQGQGRTSDTLGQGLISDSVSGLIGSRI